MLLRRFPSLPNWPTAFRELDDMRRDMDRLFSTLTGRSGVGTAGVYPAMNITENDRAILVRAELPGVKADALDISLENRTLTISGERKRPERSGEASYHRQEREWGTFRRSVSIQPEVQADRVQARLQDGVLTVELPKAPAARPKQIAVQAGA